MQFIYRLLFLIKGDISIFNDKNKKYLNKKVQNIINRSLDSHIYRIYSSKKFMKNLSIISF